MRTVLAVLLVVVVAVAACADAEPQQPLSDGGVDSGSNDRDSGQDDAQAMPTEAGAPHDAAADTTADAALAPPIDRCAPNTCADQPGSVCDPATGACRCHSTCPLAGQSECDAGRVRRCEPAETGCLAWSTPTRCPDGACADSASCRTCEHACELAARECAEGRERSCVSDAAGCRAFGEWTPCAAEACADATQCGYRVGGVVSGLQGTLRLTLDDAETLSLTQDGRFAFDAILADEQDFALRVDQHPMQAQCSIAGAPGVIARANVASLRVRCEGAPFALAATPTYVKAGNTAAGDNFGHSLALWGETLAVGAYRESSSGRGVDPPQQDRGAAESGAVYVFSRTRTFAGSPFWLRTFIKAPNADAGDRFGYAVALQGDTLVVGAPREDGSVGGVDPPDSDDSNWAGAVYVFVRQADNWALQARIKASQPGASDLFGSSVALSGDGGWRSSEGAGMTLVVGAPGEAAASAQAPSDNSAPRTGAVYVFVRTGATWRQQAYLKVEHPDVDDYFGHSVALSGDTLLAGAYGEAGGGALVGGDAADDSKPAAGAAYVFERAGEQWVQSAYLKASASDGMDHFGWSVALSGDLLAVGAPREASTVPTNDDNDGRPGTGAVYMFRRSSGAFRFDGYLKSAALGEDGFGRSVALSGPFLVVGAEGEDSFAGAAHLFERAPAGWTHARKLTATNADASDWFGHDVALDNGRVAVSAPFEDSNARGIDGSQQNDPAGASYDSGAVYFYGVAPP